MMLGGNSCCASESPLSIYHKTLQYGLCSIRMRCCSAKSCANGPNPMAVGFAQVQQFRHCLVSLAISVVLLPTLSVAQECCSMCVLSGDRETYGPAESVSLAWAGVVSHKLRDKPCSFTWLVDSQISYLLHHSHTRQLEPVQTVHLNVPASHSLPWTHDTPDV